MIKLRNKLSNAFYIVLCVAFLSSCSDGDKYDKLVLTDLNTGKVYLLKHNVGDTYMIDVRVKEIIGNDTIVKFK